MNQTTIKDQVWSIEEKNCDEIKGKLEANGMCFGLCEYPEKRITIAENIGLEQKMMTLYHELVHAFIYAYGFIYFDKFNQEQMADFFGVYGEKISDIVRTYFSD